MVATFKSVDTCAAEFEAYTPYYYSTYDRGDDEVKGNTAKKVMILGGGPNRIGQGIEFDYVITLCDQANESCPFFPGKTRRLHMGFDDPPKLAAGCATALQFKLGCKPT